MDTILIFLKIAMVLCFVGFVLVGAVRLFARDVDEYIPEPVLIGDQRQITHEPEVEEAEAPELEGV